MKRMILVWFSKNLGFLFSNSSLTLGADNMGMNSTEKLFVTEKNKIKRCCLFKNQNDPLSAGESRFLLLLLLLGTLQNNNRMGPINRLTYFLPAWVKLCVFIRALQLKMGTRFAELGQENMPPLLPPIFTCCFLVELCKPPSACFTLLASPLSTTWPHTEPSPLPSPSSSCLLRAPALHFFLSSAALESRCQVFVKVVQAVWSTTGNRT